MTLTLLLIGGIAVAAAAVFMMATRQYETQPALAGEATAIGLRDPAAETLRNNPLGGSTGRTEWQLTTLSALRDAEDFLDCLEAQGYEERELVVLGNSSFAVRWR